MAESPAHRFGQIIGNMLEEIIYPFLKKFTDENGYYIDKAGIRGKARPGKKVTWEDKYGNSHDLDFVIEDGGTKNKRGRPLAFIEAAWRRYTKHSRNKAQEIQGALLPIAEKYSWDIPFLGVVIAGIFTESSIQQLKSVGFNVLYFPYDSIVSTFREYGIDVNFDESTPDEEFAFCVERINKLSSKRWKSLKKSLINRNQDNISQFISELKKALTRTILKILICPLFGNSSEFNNIKNAVEYLNGDFKTPKPDSLKKIDVVVEYSNGDKIEGSFKSSQKAIEFLEYARK